MHPLHDTQIDRDHDYLISRFSDLYGTLCWEPSQRTAHLSLLEDLKAHVVDHFAREELLMEGMCFPGLAKHRQAHHRMRRAFTRGIQHLEDPTQPLRPFLMRMRERLLAHIVTWDEAFGEWLSLHPSMQRRSP